MSKEIKKVQAKLKELGLYGWSIDGISGTLTKEAIIKFQIMHPPLKVDGIAGKNTQNVLFEKQIENRDSYSQTKIISEYGKPGEELVRIISPYKFHLAWDKGKTIDSFMTHRKIKPNLEAIFEDTLAYYGKDELSFLNLDLFGGCFNIRPIRGGSKLSTHSWGLAIDLNPAENQLTWDSSKAKFSDIVYNPFWNIVEKYGGISFGRTKGYDYMHIQFLET